MKSTLLKSRFIRMNKVFILLSCFFFLFSCSSTRQAVVFDDEELAVIIANKANEYFNKGDYKNAIAAYQVIIDRFDSDLYEKDVAWAYYEIGFCYYYDKKYEDAIGYFDVVLQDFTIMAPRVLAAIVLEDIYELKPKLRPIDKNFEDIGAEVDVIDYTIN